MHYELWDLLSRNLLADFDSESDALTAVRDILAINPPEMADELVLVRRDGGEHSSLTKGAALAVLVGGAAESADEATLGVLQHDPAWAWLRDDAEEVYTEADVRGEPGT
jgi:hypothetical protein